MNVSILAVPFDSGLRSMRMGRGPDALLRSGLGEALEAAGCGVRLTMIGLPPETFPSEIASAFALHREIAHHVATARARHEFPIILAGNCNTALGTVAGILGGGGAMPAVFWFDAHADFNIPETTTSGFLDGMAVTMLAGMCWQTMAASVPGFRPVPESSIALVGARDLDPLEAALLATSRVTRIAADDVRTRLGSVVTALAASAAESYLHVDLDVLDITEGRANSYASPDGIGREALIDALRIIDDTLPACALALTAYDPDGDDGRITAIAREIALRVVGRAISLDASYVR
ncbi:MAG: arginase family protein [Gemmatimonadaceae bacterium]